MNSDKSVKGYELEEMSFLQLQELNSNNIENAKQMQESEIDKSSNNSNFLSIIGKAIIYAIVAIGSLYLMIFAEIFSSSGKPKKKTKRKYYYTRRKGWY